MKNTEYIDNLLAKSFANESMTAAEENDLHTWIELNRDEYGRLQELMDSRKTIRREIDFDSVSAWSKVEPQLHEKTSEPNKVIKPLRYTLYKMVGLAAMILIVVGIGMQFFKHTKGNDQAVAFINQTDKMIQQILPDHSVLKIYPGAKYEYKLSPDKTKRLLSMIGKIYFDVKRDTKRPFIIQAYDMEVRVLGTSFLVNASSKDKAQVAVRSGVVRVSSNHQMVELRANQQADVTFKIIRTSRVPSNSSLFDEAPRLLKFVNTPITEVVNQLEAIYHVEIELGEGVEENKVTTQIKLEKLNDILVELSYLCNCELIKLNNNHYKLYYQKRE